MSVNTVICTLVISSIYVYNYILTTLSDYKVNFCEIKGTSLSHPFLHVSSQSIKYTV